MKKKSIIKYMIPILMIVFTVTAWFGVKQATAAVQRLEKIEAYYMGEPVEVGKKIDLKDISVTAEYYINDGNGGYSDYIEVKKDYTISPETVSRKGTNRVVVSYRGKKCTIEVEGKAVEEITADYVGEDIYVGAPIPLGKVEVFVTFSDGSSEQVKDFKLSDTTVSKEGVNIIQVEYKGKKANITVYGKAPLAVEELEAYYSGGSIIEGNTINKSDIKVTAIYNDGTSKPITNFNISPSIIEREGVNKITVSYGDVSTVIEIYGEERYITAMTAEYKGAGVIVGKEVKKDEIEVMVTYNDGSEEQTEEYDLFGAQILFEGENTVIVYCDSFMADITVYGVKGFAANYDNSLEREFYSPNEEHSTTVTLGMNMEVERGKFELLEVDNEVLEYAVHRVFRTEKFVGFELFYDDDEMVLEFPMAMKVAVPEDFEPETFGVYYTPNRTTIMAKVDGEFLDEKKTEYEFIVYEPGVYILVHEVSNRLVTDIIVETELEMKVNRSFSLNPVVFPLSAENRNVTYTSSDEEVATVSENGKIRTHSEGTCIITITAADESGISVEVTVEVKKGR